MITPASPNTVLANALTSAEDILAPRIFEDQPERIVFVVGTQINGAPHLGTSLVQSLAFAWASHTRGRYGVPTAVHFSALDNAPYEVTKAPENEMSYQRAYAQALGRPAIAELVQTLYRPLFDELSTRLSVPYTVETYSEQQASDAFRDTWLRLQPRIDLARWHLAPSSGVLHVRVPCPAPGCGWAEKYALNTTVHSTPDHAIVRATCLHHGRYQVVIAPDSGGYLDLATLYRNLVKEITPVAPRTLQVMVKGGDWMFGSALVDNALRALRVTEKLPLRLFCPQVITDTGAKLSKSLIREGRVGLPEGVAPWMLDTRDWPGTTAEYADGLLNLAKVFLSDPRRFFRSYSAPEIRPLHDRIPEERSGAMTDSTARAQTDTPTRVHELNLYRTYFDLVAAGLKTTEVRVKYPRLAGLQAGHMIRFRIKGTDETCDVHVEEVTEYPDFEALLDGEGAADVNPTASRDEQLANIRAIYPPEKEALGALAIKIKLIHS